MNFLNNNFGYYMNGYICLGKLICTLRQKRRKKKKRVRN